MGASYLRQDWFWIGSRRISVKTAMKLERNKIIAGGFINLVVGSR
jgi:hypothetical protein